MITCLLRNGEKFEYDTYEVHGNVTVFFREPHGKYRAYETTDIVSLDTSIGESDANPNNFN